MIAIGPFMLGIVIVLTAAFVARAARTILSDAIPGRSSVTQPWMATALFASYPFNWIALWAIGYLPWKLLS